MRVRQTGWKFQDSIPCERPRRSIHGKSKNGSMDPQTYRSTYVRIRTAMEQTLCTCRAPSTRPYVEYTRHNSTSYSTSHYHGSGTEIPWNVLHFFLFIPYIPLDRRNIQEDTFTACMPLYTLHARCRVGPKYFKVDLKIRSGGPIFGPRTIFSGTMTVLVLIITTTKKVHTGKCDSVVEQWFSYEQALEDRHYLLYTGMNYY